MNDQKQRCFAVLIDADNTSPNAAPEIFAEIAKYGVANTKRIYGDWSSSHLAGWQEILLDYALMLVQQFSYTKGKDATDMQLIIDGMDLLYSATFDGFCLISSDSDFTPLAMRLRESGVSVYGFGRKTTPKAFRQACDRFFYIENLQAEESNNIVTVAVDNPAESAALTVRQPIEGALKHLLHKAVKDSIDENTGWAFVGHIGSYLSQTQPDFDSRSYGYAKLSSMLKALGGLQFKYDDSSRMYCRKIPYGELIKLLDEAIEKFQNKQGWAKINTVEKYLKPRWD